jgi:hypothetical protein
MDQGVPWGELIEPYYPQDREQRRQAFLPASHHAADPPDAAVVFAQ